MGWRSSGLGRSDVVRCATGLCRGPAAIAARVALLVAVAAIATSTSAEIYQWTDASGRVHFTQDLAQVPPGQRAAAEDAAGKPKRSRIQRYTPPASLQPSNRSTGSASGAGAEGKTYKIRVQRAGNSMSVEVRINGRLEVPFHIDTGATDVVLPKWAAEELGLDLSDARTGVYSTANGTVTQKLVSLRSVSLGGAEVQDVPATVSESMRYGLLGLSYFNHFKYDVNPATGIVTLQRNSLAEAGVLKGGRSRMQWAQEFGAARHRISAMARARDQVPFGRTRKREQYDQEVAKLERELELLAAEADDARVPFSWRE